jgi:hypothetical protein
MRKISLLMGLILPAGCDDAPGDWTAIVYPDRTDHTDFAVTLRLRSGVCRSAGG